MFVYRLRFKSTESAACFPPQLRDGKVAKYRSGYGPVMRKPYFFECSELQTSNYIAKFGMTVALTLLLSLVRVQNFKEGLVCPNVVGKTSLDRRYIVNGMVELHRPFLEVAFFPRLYRHHRSIAITCSMPWGCASGIFCVDSGQNRETRRRL